MKAKSKTRTLKVYTLAEQFRLSKDVILVSHFTQKLTAQQAYVKLHEILDSLGLSKQESSLIRKFSDAYTKLCWDVGIKDRPNSLVVSTAAIAIESYLHFREASVTDTAIPGQVKQLNERVRGCITNWLEAYSHDISFRANFKLLERDLITLGLDPLKVARFRKAYEACNAALETSFPLNAHNQGVCLYYLARFL